MEKKVFENRIEALVERTNRIGEGSKWLPPVFNGNAAQNAATIKMEGSPLGYYFFNNVHSDAVYMQLIKPDCLGEAMRAPGLEIEPEKHWNA